MSVSIFTHISHQHTLPMFLQPNFFLYSSCNLSFQSVFILLSIKALRTTRNIKHAGLRAVIKYFLSFQSSCGRIVLCFVFQHVSYCHRCSVAYENRAEGQNSEDLTGSKISFSSLNCLAFSRS